MKKLLLLAALTMSITGSAIAQDSGSDNSGSDNSGSTSGSVNSGNSDGSDSMGGDAAGTTNAPNAPFLGNRDRIGAFYSDDSMTTMRTGDEFNTAYQALTDEDRAQITTECASPAGFERFCDAFLNVGSTTQQ